VDVVGQVKSIKAGEPDREYLTMEEVRALRDTACEIPVLKRAFLFGCLTGLRHSDILKMTWSELREESDGYSIKYQQKKTKGAVYQPVGEQAVELMGERGKPEERVFQGLKYSAWVNIKLTQWVMKAGITKKITFHCARHTYATLQLGNGTDIYTVSKLLDHKHLKTTEIYAKVMNKQKKEAANKIHI